MCRADHQHPEKAPKRIIPKSDLTNSRRPSAGYKITKHPLVNASTLMVMTKGTGGDLTRLGRLIAPLTRNIKHQKMLARLRTQRVNKSKKLAAQVTLVRAILLVEITTIALARVITPYRPRMSMTGQMTTPTKLNRLVVMMGHNTVSDNNKRAYCRHNQRYIPFSTHPPGL